MESRAKKKQTWHKYGTDWVSGAMEYRSDSDMEEDDKVGSPLGREHKKQRTEDSDYPEVPDETMILKVPNLQDPVAICYHPGAGGLSVSPMNIQENGIGRYFPLSEVSGTLGMGFAMVGTKLYAFGSHPWSYSRSRKFYVCDLKGEGQSRPYEFKRAGKLLSSKTCPIVIPFRNEKILIIGTAAHERDFSWNRKMGSRPPYCEVLNLSDHLPTAIKTPFDEVYTVCADFPYSQGHEHFVVGTRIYVQIYSSHWEPDTPHLFCFDMETLDCRECRVRDPPPPAYGISSDGYCDLPCWLDPGLGYRKSVKNIVSGDKLFSLNIAERAAPEEKFVVGVMDLRWPELVPMRNGDELGFQRLGELEEHLLAKFGYLVRASEGGVIPLKDDDDDDDGSKSNLFCLFIWCPCFSSIAVCKFRLVKKLAAAAMGLDESSSSSSPVGGGVYECDILSDACFVGDVDFELLHLLTPVGNSRIQY